MSTSESQSFCSATARVAETRVCLETKGEKIQFLLAASLNLTLHFTRTSFSYPPWLTIPASAEPWLFSGKFQKLNPLTALFKFPHQHESLNHELVNPNQILQNGTHEKLGLFSELWRPGTKLSVPLDFLLPEEYMKLLVIGLCLNAFLNYTPPTAESTCRDTPKIKSAHANNTI